ncbi:MULTISPECIES: TonB-dependent siderophore receptor [unclassified Oceanobacter]|jgi:iron complex outermembrane receptor protein|uniref:TonB-dependent receptor plug domain-containing protein n=1 Tax=unclassified Oceanobacter TaxID=2620260 RepID=UPI002736226E|nr:MULTISPECIES: TonB-dependent receptor [unclassified Oceanobacter]MDP2505170.1 TonB-dependent receptor [Oceanobacter sp. 3_MG-2023]MDP2549157.1 TonB-dependent receptor [Oceanobacter sp. 4_MG-2023]
MEQRYRKAVPAGVLSIMTAMAASADNTDRFELGRIEVSAEQTLPATSSESIDTQALREENRETVGEALDLLPGVTLSTFGSRNEQTLYIRGNDLRQIPVFIDGIPVYVPYDGYVDLGRFTTYDLAEINVSKGFSSVLYGPNTLGGAINLISRRPQQIWEGDIGIGYASGEQDGSDSQRVWMNIGSNQGLWYSQISASWLDQNAWALSDDFEAVDTEDGGLRDNSYRNDQKISLKLGYTPNSSDEYAIGYINQQGEKGTPPYAGTDSSTSARYWQWPYWNKESLYVVTQTSLGEGRYIKSRVYYDIFENSLYSYDDDSYSSQTYGYAFRSWYDDYSYGASLEYGQPLGNHSLKAALHYKLDHHEEHDDDDPKQNYEDDIVSLAVEDTWMLSPQQYLVAGISHDRRRSLQAEEYDSDTGLISDFDNNNASAWNPQIGWFAQLDKQREVRLTLSRKTRFPTIKDRYSYRMGSALPNPDLEAEKSTILEAGGSQLWGDWLRLDGTVFYSKIRDLIQSVDLDEDTYQLQNIGKVTSKGLELSAVSWIGDSLQLDANYSLLKRTNDSSDLVLTDVPDHKLQGRISWQATDPLRLAIRGQYESERYSDSDGTIELAAWSRIDLTADYDFTQTLKGQLGVTNLGDRNYALDDGFPEPGRQWHASLNWQF